MKKTSIKVFGVCAATLLTLGAVAPVAVHAEENINVESRWAVNNNATLKDSVDLTTGEVKELFNSLSNPKEAFFGHNDIKNVGVINDQDNDFSDQNLDDLEGLQKIFNASSGTVYNNLDLPAGDMDNTTVVVTVSVAKDSTLTPGDSFEVKFWANNVNTTSNRDYTLVGKSTVHVKSFESALDYSIHATNIHAQIGDIYNPAQNVTVKNKKDGYTINNAVYVISRPDEDKPNKVSFFGPSNIVKDTDITFDNLIKGKKPAVENMNRAVAEAFGYSPEQYYILFDDTQPEAFSESVNVKRQTTEITTDVIQIVEFYNTNVKDFNQNLKVVVPSGELKEDTYPVLSANRMINVTGETEGETPIPEETKVPVYRAYNPNNGDHLFTTSLKEYNEVVDKGWAPEGLAWNAATEEDGTKPVYRLYNPNSGEHFYTDSEKEYNEVATAGWNKEGIAFYSAASEDGVKIFRSFNPNATGPGSHMFTDSEKEYNELTAAGWSPEGVAFYGIK